MNSKLFQSFTPALIGAVTVAAVGIPQAAQAGTVRASSRVDFQDVTLQLIDNDSSGDGIANVWDISFAEVDAAGAINGVDPVDGPPLAACSNTPINTTDGGSEFPFSLGGGTINAGASVDCSTSQADASNFATIELTGDDLSGFSEGEYQIFSNNFNATAGDIVDIEGLLAFGLYAEVEDFVDGLKVASAEFEAQYTINRIVGNQATEVFAGQVFSGGVSVINDNAVEQQGSGGANVGFNQLGNQIAFGNGIDPAFDYTIEEDGVYEVRLAAVENVTGRIDREQVPEPASLLGLLAVGGALGFLKRRQNH